MITHVRNHEEGDYPRMAEVVAEAMPGMAPNAEMLRGGYRALEAEGGRFSHVVAERDRELVGWATYMNRPSVHGAGLFEVQFHLRAAERDGPTGKLLGERILGELRAIGARRARGRISADADSSLFRDLRFVESNRHHELALDLDVFAPKDFADRIGAVRSRGVELPSYEALASHLDHSRKLYELRAAVHGDIVSAVTVLPDTLERFERETLANPGLLAACSHVAVENERYVGWTEVTRYYLPQSVFVTLTGCLPEARGRGVATALKLQSAAAAKAAGNKIMLTLNHVDSARILMINEALGFEKKTTWVTLEREVGDA